MVSLKKKLESMVKLNKTLSQERATLLEKCKASVRDRWIMVIRWWWHDNGLRKDATTSDWDLSPPYRRLRGTWGAIATSSLYFQLSFVRYLVFVKYTKYINTNIVRETIIPSQKVFVARIGGFPYALCSNISLLANQLHLAATIGRAQLHTCSFGPPFQP